VLHVTECFDTYWRFAAERQRIFHCRASGMPPPWTADPILTPGLIGAAVATRQCAASGDQATASSLLAEA
jgi:hypothetical protein